MAARRGRRAISSGRGILLSRCRPETAVAWARRGLGGVIVAPLEGWTVVMPIGPARARYPYDDAVASMAGRPAGMWMRPTLGFLQLGRQAAITVHPAAWRAVPRWAMWTPRDGLVPPVGLPDARPSDLLTAAGFIGPDAIEHAGDQAATGTDSSTATPTATDPTELTGRAARRSGTDGAGCGERAEQLRARLRSGDGDAIGVLRDVLDLLDLPGATLLTGDVDAGDLPGARLVEPAARHARAFDRLVTEEARHRTEMEA